MVQSVTAAQSGGDRDRQLVADRLLADEVLQAARAQRAVELVLGQLPGIGQPRMDAHRRALRSACEMSSSVLSPLAPSSSSSISAGL